MSYLMSSVRWGGMGMWGEMGSLLIFELPKNEKKNGK